MTLYGVVRKGCLVSCPPTCWPDRQQGARLGGGALFLLRQPIATLTSAQSASRPNYFYCSPTCNFPQACLHDLTRPNHFYCSPQSAQSAQSDQSLPRVCLVSLDFLNGYRILTSPEKLAPPRISPRTCGNMQQVLETERLFCTVAFWFFRLQSKACLVFLSIGAMCTPAERGRHLAITRAHQPSPIADANQRAWDR